MSTDYTPTTFTIDDEDDSGICELCGGEFEGGLAICSGVSCCEECAREYGWELVQFADEMNEELRRL